MKKSIAFKWVKALRSGKYEQGKGWLNSNGKYCCLGVLCDISGLGKWDDIRYVTKSSNSDYQIDHDEVRQWSGLKDSLGILKGGLSLSAYNDGNGTKVHSFSEIADIIEEHWENL